MASSCKTSVKALVIPLRSKFVIAFSFGLAVAVYAILFFEGSRRSYCLWYYAPAAVVVGAFIVDRFNRTPETRTALLLDITIGILCLMRPIFNFPPFSGHAVFTVYVLLTCPFRSTRSLGAILLAITLYAKFILWKGDPTLIPGLWVGFGAGLLFLFLSRKTRRNDRTGPNQPL